MIRPLRIRHRHMWCVLGVIIPGIFLISLLGRTPIKPMDRLPVPVPGATAASQADEIQIVLDAADSRQIIIDVPVRASLADALVYWSPSTEVADGALMGALVPGQQHRFKLDGEGAEPSGHILVYSLAHQDLVATHPLKKPGAGP